MKILHPALIAATLLASAALARDTEAQVDIGIHGSLADVRDVSPGVGARLGYFWEMRSGGAVGVEVSGSWYFPSCRVLDNCDAWGGKALLVGKRGLGGGARTYLGIGPRYVDVNGESGNVPVKVDSWGLEILMGAEFRPERAIVPFFEFGWGFMNDAADIWEVTIGLKTSLGGSR